jgi:hypothetical protein
VQPQPLSTAIVTRGAGWPAPFRFLSGQVGLRRMIAIVLLVSAPLWLYAILTGCVALTVSNSLSTEDLAKYIAGRVLLYSLLFCAYLLAVQLPVRYPGLWRFWSLQVVISLSFLTLMYPFLLLANYWAFGVPGSVQGNFLIEAWHGDFADALAPFRLWELWLATSLELSEIYLLGLALILALNSFLRYRAEQSLAAELHAKWLEAQLAALREQIGPHFLFNALNTILASIRDEPETAERMTVELGALLRHNLDRGDQEFSTVKDEMDFVERYLAVMKMRFESNLRVSLDIEPAILECRIPAFLLLPLVENAIKHGVARVPGVNSIEIKAAYSGRCMFFTLGNSTDGAARSGGETQHRAIGLENTRTRIQRLYGSDGSFSAGFDTQGFWVVTVTMPAEPA